MRTAVVDIGTNSTRLLIADVASTGDVREIVRRSVVTRLGAGVDAGGELSPEACERVYATLREYRAEIDAHRPRGGPTGGGAPTGGDAEAGRGETADSVAAGACYPNLAVMTSAARDARNGLELAARIRSEYGLDARILTGDEEAQMTFLGAMSARARGGAGAGGGVGQTGAARQPSAAGQPGTAETAGTDRPTVVIDIGGGSTEFILGTGLAVRFHVSLPAGVVRMSERHIHGDPPSGADLQALAADARGVFLDGLPASERASVGQGIAVAGTATSAASIDQELDPYDPARVHGYALSLATVELLLARLAEMDEAGRRAVVGLDPSRAPTIVAGMVLLAEAMRAFDLDEVEVSEHDILHGGALTLAGTYFSADL
jgi:exopolyphosphatase/guanosine-5'-triphosphate,3'-diphosphate pyrophosphatase